MSPLPGNPLPGALDASLDRIAGIFSPFARRILGLGSGPSGSGNYIDPRFKRVLWYLIGSTKGGVNRARIIDTLNEKPSNPNQLATELGMDYKTVLHHLKVLVENGLIITDNKESYGAVYFLTPMMEKNYQSFVEILAKIRIAKK